MKEDQLVFVKLTLAAMEHYRKSGGTIGYKPLTDDVGISMMDLESYHELCWKYNQMNRRIQFFDPAFGVYSCDTSKGIGYDIFIDHHGKISFMVPQTKPLTTTEIEEKLKVPSGYVDAMKGAGFKMLANLASIFEVKSWLAKHPKFMNVGRAQ